MPTSSPWASPDRRSPAYVSVSSSSGRSTRTVSPRPTSSDYHLANRHGPSHHTLQIAGIRALVAVLVLLGGLILKIFMRPPVSPGSSFTASSASFRTTSLRYSISLLHFLNIAFCKIVAPPLVLSVWLIEF